MALRLAPDLAWADVLGRAIAATPEAFADGRPRNLIDGVWTTTGSPRPVHTPVDGTVLAELPRVDADVAQAAVAAAAAAHRAWSAPPLAERTQRVSAALDLLSHHRDLLALLLVWEIGKPWRLACADVDRALDGVRWYLGRDRPPGGRPRPAGRAGEQHRQLELPDERAGARRAGAAARRQRGDRQDARRRAARSA